MIASLICLFAAAYALVVIVMFGVKHSNSSPAQQAYLQEHHIVPAKSKPVQNRERLESRIIRFNNALRREDGVVSVIKVAQAWAFMGRDVWQEGHFTIEQVNGERSPQMYMSGLAVFQTEIRLYVDILDDPNYVSFPTQGIQWFGRPKKYSSGKNDIWLHVEKKAGWFTYKITLFKEDMQDFVRALKQVTPERLVTAYRRRRPYIHYGPVSVQPAEQDIHGAWELDPPQTLYLTPLQLVFLNGQRVTRIIALEGIQKIRAGARLDAPDADGLVQFKVEDEKVAFALNEYIQLAESLAEAAKRSLEAPVMQKSKSKDDDEDV